MTSIYNINANKYKTPTRKTKKIKSAILNLTSPLPTERNSLTQISVV